MVWGIRTEKCEFTTSKVIDQDYYHLATQNQSLHTKDFWEDTVYYTGKPFAHH